MSSASTTIRESIGASTDPFDVWAANALAEAAQRLGQREQGGKNCGPIVEYSLRDLTRRKPTPDGWAKWCAAFASQVYLRTAPTPELRKAWLALASTSCDTLWERLARKGLVRLWEPGEMPRRGELAFMGTAEDLRHVGLVAVPDAMMGSYEGIEGNTGNEVARTIWNVQTGLRVRPKAGPAHAPLFGFAKVQL